jgi:hypothetical protein
MTDLIYVGFLKELRQLRDVDGDASRPSFVSTFACRASR